MKLKVWWHSLDSTERKWIIFIAVALLGYLAFWVFYFLGYLPHLDQPEQ